jgi:hypothetical protein
MPVRGLVHEAAVAAQLGMHHDIRLRRSDPRFERREMHARRVRRDVKVAHVTEIRHVGAKARAIDRDPHLRLVSRQ